MEAYRETAEWLSSRLEPSLARPQLAVICGTGLSGLAAMVEADRKISFRYGDIPHFPQTSVDGHVGELVFGYLGKVPAVLMVGRTHYYEGRSFAEITYPIRVFSLLGVYTMLVTNAAGGLNPTYSVGDIVVLGDHIFLAGLAGVHPLRGPNIEEFGPRFPPMSDAYDLELRRCAHAAWKEIAAGKGKRKLHEGVYAFVGGPNYETRAECRMLRTLGADVVGMSTVPETIVARHAGIRVLAMSLVTNSAVLEPGPRGDDPTLDGVTADNLKDILEKGRANHEEVVEEGRAAAIDFQDLVAQILEIFFEDKR